jgi:uncharacterized protein (TIGR00725 family)
MPQTMIGIIGGHFSNTTPQALEIAEVLGEEIGRRGMAVVCGGEDGIMEAACRGCKRSGGVTVGILKGNAPPVKNEYLDYAILTSMDVASNNIVVWSAAGILALDGRYGTLNEIALALDFGKPLISVGVHRYLRLDHIDSTRFAHYEGYDASKTTEILDRLVDMIQGGANGAAGKI